MKHEFEKMVNTDLENKITITDEMYQTIELVYMYHPAIEGKEDIAKLFLWFGMTVIMDMAPRAEDMKVLESQIQVAESNLQRLREEKRTKSKK